MQDNPELAERVEPSQEEEELKVAFLDLFVIKDNVSIVLCSYDGHEDLPTSLPEALAAIKIIGSSWPAQNPRTSVSPPVLWPFCIVMSCSSKTTPGHSLVCKLKCL